MGHKEEKNINLLDKDRLSSKEYFEAIYRRYFDSLLAFSITITHSPEMSSEVISDVFYSMWKREASISSIENLDAYLFTAVRNQSARVMSKCRHYLPLDIVMVDSALMDSVDPEELMIGRELDEFLDATVKDLPPQCQEVFRRIRISEMKYDQVAVEMGISRNTVKYHLKTALKKIKGALSLHFHVFEELENF